MRLRNNGVEIPLSKCSIVNEASKCRQNCVSVLPATLHHYWQRRKPIYTSGSREDGHTIPQFCRFSCAIWFGKKFFFTIQTRLKWIDGILLERGKNSITAILLKQTIDAVIVWYNYGMNDIYLYWNICRYLSFAVVVLDRHFLFISKKTGKGEIGFVLYNHV